jgi:hypothetical protein
LRKNELHEETQGKLLEYKLSFALTVDWILTSSSSYWK